MVRILHRDSATRREDLPVRLSREIHGGLEQELNGFLIDLLWLRSQLDKESDPMRKVMLGEKIRSMMTHLKLTMRDVRRIVMDLGSLEARSDRGGLRVLIADVHAVVRHGVKQILSDETEIRAFGEARSGQEILEQVRSRPWDIVILDINLPGRGGLDVLKEVKQLKPDLPVLVLSMYPEEQFAMRSLKGGASGYLIKESTSEELVGAIRKILEGGRFVSAALAERIALDLNAPENSHHKNLSDREFQLLRLIGSGKTVSEAAREMHLSIKTVSTYRTRLLQKMHMRTNAALVHYAIHNGLIR